ncbi:MAG: S41 family peptidase [Bacillota bacterium]|nr:S41 family peptidase [Bacillota bacterium]
MKTVSMKILVVLLVIVFLSTVLLTATFTYLATTNMYGPIAENPSLNAKVQEIRKLITDKYYKPVDETKLDIGMLKGLVFGLNDPYSTYMTAEETQKFLEDEQGNYQGIGIQVTQNPETYEIKITGVFKDSPAKKAGLLPGDIIIAVDGTDVTAMNVDEVVPMMRGEQGTQVKVTVLRGEETMEYDIIRDVVNIEYVKWHMPPNGIGYVQISEFSGNCAEKFNEAVDDLKARGMKALIIDLRDNPGGLVDQTSAIADILLPQGIIFYTLDRQGVRKDENASPGALDIPMAVLVNENSASASELLSGALQDNGVPLIGTKTFGKGIIQSFISLKDGDTLKLTISEYFTPEGREIQGIGLTPDYIVELPEELQGRPDLLNDSNDTQLQKALEVIEGKLASL